MASMCAHTRHCPLGAKARARLWFWILAACLALTICPVATRAQGLAEGGPVDFGASLVGTPSGKISLNFNATVRTVISAVTVVTEGAARLDFTLLNQDCVGVQLPSASCLITLQFTPTQVGARKGWLAIQDSSGDIVNNVPLRGIGQGPLMVLDAPLTASATTNIAGVTPSSFMPAASVLDGQANLYVNDLLNSRLLEIAPNGNATVLGIVTGTPQSSLALNGYGTLFASSPAQHAVFVLPPAGTLQPLSTPGVTLAQPTGLAVDGTGYLYIADAGAGSLVRVAPDGTSATTLTPGGLAIPLNNPGGLAFDLNHNLYIADTGNNRIVQLSLITGQAAPIAVSGISLSGPTGLAVAPSGTLVVADTGNARFVSIAASGAGTPLVLSGVTTAQPVGVTLTDSGDLLLTDLVAGLITVHRNAATYNFPTATPVGSLDSTDGQLTITVANQGTESLKFATPSSGANPSQSGISYSFPAPGSTCPVVAAGEAPSAVDQLGSDVICTLLVSFSPLNTGPNPSTIVIAGEAVGGGSPTSLSVQLNGIGTSRIDHFLVTATPAVTTLGAPVSITVTAIDSNGAVYSGYTGHVVFTATDPRATFLFAGGYTFTTADGGTHTFSAPASGIAFGSLGTFTVSVADNSYTGTSNPVQVVQAAVASTLTASPNPVLAGAPLTLSVTFASGNTGLISSPPAGTVQFLDGTNSLGTATLTNGAATLLTTFSQAGQHQVSAVYAGNSQFLAASAATSVTVVDFTFAVVSGTPTSGAIAASGGSVAYSFVLTPTGASALPTGVSFTVNGLPAAATYAFRPGQLTAGAGVSALTFTVTEAAQLASLRPPSDARPDSRGFGAAASLALAGLLGPVVFRRRFTTRLLARTSALVLVSSLWLLAGCLSTASSGYYDGSLNGATGAQGSSGSSGATGVTGASGATGSSGASTGTGATGNTGPSGSTGTSGSTGSTGSIGSSGSTGSAGTSGPGGSTGPAAPGLRTYSLNVTATAGGTLAHSVALTLAAP